MFPGALEVSSVQPQGIFIKMGFLMVKQGLAYLTPQLELTSKTRKPKTHLLFPGSDTRCMTL